MWEIRCFCHCDIGDLVIVSNFGFGASNLISDASEDSDSIINECLTFESSDIKISCYAKI